MDMHLKPFEYNKTVMQEDGITHTVDTEHNYIGYQLLITETYFKEDKQEVVECVIKDLDRLKDRILNILENNQEKDDNAKLR